MIYLTISRHWAKGSPTTPFRVHMFYSAFLSRTDVLRIYERGVLDFVIGRRDLVEG